MTYISAAIREQVRLRAKGCCEYCGLPELYSFQSHEVDHITSVKHGGSSQLRNLAYACFYCNNAKGTDIAARDPSTQKLTLLFNPRTQKWNRHFEIKDGLIVGKTNIGRATVHLLKINASERVALRRILIDDNLWE
jgi:hypothetical protein